MVRCSLARILFICGLLVVLIGEYRSVPSVVALTQPQQVTAFGMNTYFSGLERLPQNRNDDVMALIDATRSLGAEWAREEISWANLEPSKGFFTWELMDAALTQTAN
ncbi:MAG: hypothetical protein D6823_01260, partial [Chloroflexi bacterium]